MIKNLLTITASLLILTTAILLSNTCIADSAKPLQQLADKYYEEHNYALAEQTYRQSIQISLSQVDFDSLAYLRHQLAFTYLAQGKRMEALPPLRANLDYHILKGDFLSAQNYFLYIAQTYFELGENEKTKSTLLNAQLFPPMKPDILPEMQRLLAYTYLRLDEINALRALILNSRNEIDEKSWTANLKPIGNAIGLHIGYHEKSLLLSPQTILLLSLVVTTILLTVLAWRWQSQRQRIGKILLVTISFGFSITLIEVALRYQQHAHANVQHFLNFPDRSTTFFPAKDILPGITQKEIHFSVNKDGIRGDEIPGDNRYKILAVGGSSTETLYLDDLESWPYVLQEKLSRDKGKPIWVGNAGKSGLNSFSHLVQTYFYAREIKPDAIIIQAGINDLNQCISGGKRSVLENAKRAHWPDFVFDYQQHVFEKLELKNNDSKILLFSMLKNFFHPQNVVNEDKLLSSTAHVVQDEAGTFYVKQRQRRIDAHKLDRQPQINGCLNAYEENLKHIANIAKEFGITLIYITQGSLYRTDLSISEEKLLWFGSVNAGFFEEAAPKEYFTARVMKNLLHEYNLRMLKVCTDEHLACWDTEQYVTASTENYYDDVHLNIGGAQRLAQGLAKFLEKTLPL